MLPEMRICEIKIPTPTASTAAAAAAESRRLAEIINTMGMGIAKQDFPAESGGRGRAAGTAG